MNIFDKTITLSFLAAMLVSCNSVPSTPTMSQADFIDTAIATVSTAFAETQRGMPTITPLPTLTPLSPPTFASPTLEPTSTWITAYGLPGNQIVTKIHPTKDGGFILVGNTLVDQLPGPSWLLKLHADGRIVWQKSLPLVRALDVLETSAGDFILAADIDWIKFDSQGNLLWQYTIGWYDYDRSPGGWSNYYQGRILRLVEENNGNIVVEALGSRVVFSADVELQSFTYYDMDWDRPGGVRARSGETLWAGEGGDHQYWVGKADLNNGWLNVFTFPEKPIGGPLLIQTLADGGALVSVPVYGEVGYDLLISQFSRDGSVRWQNVYGGYVSEPHIAFETRSGDFIIAGTVSYDSTDSFRDDVRIMRLDRDGNIRWVKAYGTEGKDAAAVIQELSNGDLIFAGQTNGAGAGHQDMWVLKTNAQGEIPNCGLALDGPDVWTRGVSPEVKTRAIEGVSLRERDRIPISEEEQRHGDADVRVIPLCSPSP